MQRNLLPPFHNQLINFSPEPVTMFSLEVKVRVGLGLGLLVTQTSPANQGRPPH
jgi:hypothetical protein